MLRHIISFIWFFFLVVLAAGSSQLLVGQEQRIKDEGSFGCFDRETSERLIKYAVQGDREVLDRSLADQEGACIRFQAGEVVYIMDTAIFSGLLKVRRKGEDSEYWTAAGAVEPASSPSPKAGA